MCLKVIDSVDKAAKVRQDDPVIRYKIVSASSNKVSSWFYRWFTWAKGWNYAVGKRMGEYDGDYVSEGIHVYCFKKDAQFDYWLDAQFDYWLYVGLEGDPMLMEVKCFKEDLIAAGTYDGVSSEAYKKVFVENLPVEE